MNDNKTRSASMIAALIVLALFAVGILSVLLGGAGAYRRLTARDQQAYEDRTCSQYLATKLRQASCADAVEVLPFGDTDALRITQILEGEVYETRIYCHDGWLMELFSLAGGEFSPEDGEQILEAKGLKIQNQQGLYTLELTGEDGKRILLTLSARGGEVQS